MTIDLPLSLEYIAQVITPAWRPSNQSASS
jgi:hypothetical protein